MGLTDPVFRMSEAELLAALFDGARGRVADTDLDAVRSGRPMRYAAPEGQEFRTPSGRLEFYSEQLAAAGLAPMPDWQPDAQEERDAARWPLRLLTAPGYFQAHTAYSGVEFLRRREGPPYCILHPGRGGAARPRRWRQGSAVQRARRGRSRAAGQRRGASGRGARAGAATRQRDAGGHDQSAVLRPLYRYRRGRDVPEHVSRHRRVVKREPYAGRMSAAQSADSMNRRRNALRFSGYRPADWTGCAWRSLRRAITGISSDSPSVPSPITVGHNRPACQPAPPSIACPPAAPRSA